MLQIQQLLQNAYQSLSAGHYEAGLEIAQKALQLAPNNADTLHMMALAHKACGDINHAINFFEKSLAVNFSQKHVVQHYLNFLMQLAAYQHIQSLMQRAVAVWPNHYQFHIYLGISLKELKRYEEAITVYDTALRIKPNDTVTLHNKGVALRLFQKPKEAIACYDRIQGGSQIPELRLNRGCALMDLLEFEKAEKEFQAALQLNPALIDAHENINKLYWEQEKTDQVMSTYEIGIKKSDSEVMRLSYISQLMNIGQDDQAEESISDAITIFGPQPALRHMQGRLLAKKGEYDGAIDCFEKAVQAVPHMARYRLDLANNLIRMARYEEALKQLDQAELLTPDDQELWAYKGTCWRLLGDPSHDWLNNYDLFVQALDIPLPAGYDSKAHFISELSDQIKLFHTTKIHPLDQSLRGGTQSSFFLLGHESQIIQDFKASLTQAVATYLKSMPVDNDHPFLRRINSNHHFTFSGSWSVRLKSEGYHVNHMHPEGWLSGPTYIDVPPEIHAEDPSRAGWVKFGETGLNLGPERESVAKAVCPKQGQVVFFPSYMWHGTYPFESDLFRTTAPMDVMPA